MAWTETLIERARDAGACEPGLEWARSLDPVEGPPAATGAAGIRAWGAWAAARGGGEYAGWCVGRLWAPGDLSGADLAGARLAGADLAWASLTGANLTGADLTGADLTGARLAWADLA